MSDTPPSWTEEDARLYREIAEVAVPFRDEQIATLLALVPFDPGEPFRAIELGCGDGALSYALLEAFPNATITSFDGSQTMRARAAKALERFGSRAKVAAFDLTATEWLAGLRSPDCVVSSLVLHHLADDEKRRLYARLCTALSSPGALLIADLVEPQRPEAREVMGATWDRVTRAQSTKRAGSETLFQRFLEARWNHFRYPDVVDRPSPLFDQLVWLKAAGFKVVDCFWLQAGHAIYGGYKTRHRDASHLLSFDDALRAARAGLQRASSPPEA
jgi:tRNA (cmo5U34)-methyltransferase